MKIRYLHFISAAIFLLMAVVQLNDPDPIYWTVVYAAVAWIAGSFALGRKQRALLFGVAGMIVAGLLISAPGFIDYLQSGHYSAITGEMSESRPYVESAREFLGLLISAAAVSFYVRKTN